MTERAVAIRYTGDAGDSRILPAHQGDVGSVIAHRIFGAVVESSQIPRIQIPDPMDFLNNRYGITELAIDPPC